MIATRLVAEFLEIGFSGFGFEQRVVDVARQILRRIAADTLAATNALGARIAHRARGFGAADRAATLAGLTARFVDGSAGLRAQNGEGRRGKAFLHPRSDFLDESVQVQGAQNNTNGDRIYPSNEA